MKKLMVILGASLMASIASAASVTWSASETFSDSKGVAFDSDNNPVAYLFDASTVAQTVLFASWNGGTADVSGAKVTSTWFDAYELDVSAAIGTSGSKTLYWAVVNGDDLFISSTMTKEISAMGSTDFIWDDESGNVFKDAVAFGSAGWYTKGTGPGPVPTPEPTTGLLMLVGLAGLALRRRRA